MKVVFFGAPPVRGAQPGTLARTSAFVEVLAVVTNGRRSRQSNNAFTGQDCRPDASPPRLATSAGEKNAQTLTG